MVLLSVFCLSIASAQIIENDSSVIHKQLDNGFTYYLKQNDLPKNRIELKLVVKAGSLCETKKEQGLAHYLEHMAFNGTKNFPKNELVSFIESCGMGFGSDLNAYTSFTETVYRFTLPADSAQYLATGLQIIRDWTSNLSIDADEVDKEKGVILEEWRLGKGVSDRVLEKTIPVLLANSQYANRLPIGQPKVIKKANPKGLRHFYEKWYRPDLMALVVTGDINCEELETQIRALFSTLPKPEMTKDKTFKMAQVATNKSVIISDKEIAALNLDLYMPMPYIKVNTFETYKASLHYSLLNSLLLNRFSELNAVADLPYRYSGAYYSSIISGVDCFNVNMGLKYGTIKEGILKHRKNLEQIEAFGFVDAEYELVKKDFLNGLKRLLKNKDNINSNQLASEYTAHFLKGVSYPSNEDFVRLATKAVEQIELQDLNSIIKRTLDKEYSSILKGNSEKLQVTHLKDSLAHWLTMDLDHEPIEYVFTKVDDTLLNTLPKKGSIVRTQYMDATQTTVWTLNNGLTVTCKNVGNQEDFIAFTGFKKGGLSILPDSLVNTGKHVSRFMENMSYGGYTKQEMNAKLAGKKVYSGIFVGDEITNLLGYCDHDDLEAMFQLLYLNLTKLNRDSVQFKKTKTKLKENLKNKSKEPGSIFSDSIKYKIQGYNRFTKESTLEEIEGITLDKVMHVNQQFTSNANGFQLFFTGDVDTTALKPYVEQYLGALPYTPEVKSSVDRGNRYRSGYERFVFRAGEENKSTVRMIFTGAGQYSVRQQLLSELSFDILEQVLTQEIREDGGFTYSVSAYGGIDTYPIDQFQNGISFGSSPDKVEQAIAAIWDVIQNLEDKVSDEQLEKAKKKAKRGFEKNMEWHGYWLAVLMQLAMEGEHSDEILKYQDYWESITKQEVIHLLKQQLTKENYLEAIMLPVTQK